jgi:O-antigen/teichoic acid export membrane protein
MAKNSPGITFMLQLGKAALAAGTVIFMSRWMGAEGRGEIGLLLFYVNLFMVFNEYVGGSSLANYSARNTLASVVPAALLWSIITLLVGGIALQLWVHNVAMVLQVILMAAPLMFLTIIYNIYHGRARVFRRNVLGILNELFRFLLIIGLAYLFIIEATQGGEGLSLWGTHQLLDTARVALANGLAAFLVLCIALLLSAKSIANFFLNYKKTAVPKGFFSDGFWAQNGQLVQFLNYRLSLLVIASFLGNEEVGVYANALLIAESIWIFGNSFGAIAHMRILQSQNAVFQADITLRYAVVAAAGTALACGVVWLLPTALYTAVFGPEFADLRDTAIWMFPAILALGCSTLFSHYLHAINKFKFLLIANTAGLLLQTGLSFWLIPYYGLKGAAMAAKAGFILILVCVFVAFKKANPQATLRGKLNPLDMLHTLWKE